MASIAAADPITATANPATAAINGLYAVLCTLNAALFLCSLADDDDNHDNAQVIELETEKIGAAAAAATKWYRELFAIRVLVFVYDHFSRIGDNGEFSPFRFRRFRRYFRFYTIGL